MSPTVRVQRDGGRGHHLIAKEKYDASPGDFVLCDESGEPFEAAKAPAPGGPCPECGAAEGEPHAATCLRGARADYEAALGKKPYHGWDAAGLREKIEAAKAA